MSAPDIIEQQPDDYTEDVDGNVRTGRNWSILARSQMEAAQKLKDIGVFRGVPWQTLYGETRPGVVCTGITIQPSSLNPVGVKSEWFAHAGYATKSNRTEKKPVPGGPPVYTRDASAGSGPIDIDGDGMPILNSSGEPITGVNGTICARQINVKWWVREFSEAMIDDYIGALNIKTWHNKPPGCVMIQNIQDEPSDEGFIMSAKIEYKPEIVVADFPLVEIFVRDGATGWKKTTKATLEGFTDLQPDRGRRVIKVGATGTDTKTEYTPLLGADNNPIQDPVNLDGKGKKLSETPGTKQIVLAFKPNKLYKNFADLGI